MKSTTTILKSFLAKTVVACILLYLPVPTYVYGIITALWLTAFAKTMQFFHRLHKASEKAAQDRIRRYYSK